MDIERFLSVSSLVAGIPAIVLSIIAIRVTMRQARERATSTPDVSLDWRILPLTSVQSGQTVEKYLLEVRAKVDNGEHTAVCFPFAYARYRAPIDTSNGEVVMTPMTCRQFQ